MLSKVFSCFKIGAFASSLGWVGGSLVFSLLLTSCQGMGPATPEPLKLSAKGKQCLTQLQSNLKPSRKEGSESVEGGSLYSKTFSAEETQILAHFTTQVGRCPSPGEFADLKHIWSLNGKFWALFPESAETFFTENYVTPVPETLQALTGMTPVGVKRYFQTQETLAAEKKGKPVTVGTVDYLSFGGGKTSYLLAMRNGTVSRVYTFDDI